MTRDELLELSVDDLKLLGRFYMTDPGLLVEDSDGEICLVPRPVAWWSYVAAMLFLAIPFGGFAVAFSYAATGIGHWILIGLIGLLGILGPVVGQKLRLNYLQQNSPLLRYCEYDGLVTILADSRKFRTSDVYALIGLSLPHSSDGAASELQLIVRDQDKLVPQLIVTAQSNSATATFVKILRQFGGLTGVRTMVAEPSGFCKTGKVTLRILTPELRSFDDID